ncbi:MAG TPA: hypothetical protein VF533_09255 [Solirubrobacteraceae bacterium]|jgi:hypothetical protein
MYARVAKWEGATPEGLRRNAETIRGSSEPPPGVPSNGIMVLNDETSGRSMAIVLFATEEDMRAGDEALDAMNPTDAGGDGRRTSVELYEVAVDIRL